MLLSRFAEVKLSVGLIVLGAGVASAQDYPNKAIRIYTAAVGGGSDFVARLIAQGISGPLGQPVVVENRGTTLAAEAVSNAPPDGYTVLVQGSGIWLVPLLVKTPYDAVRDFSPISLITRQVSILAVHPSVPAKSVKELIALAKARPGELNYGSPPIGTSQQLGLELFKSMAGINVVNVPYKGGALVVTAVITGEVQMLIYDVGVLAPHLKSGKMRALAVTSATPSALVPELPTVAASGLPGYELVGLTTIFAPAKTPAVIIRRLNEAIVRFLNLPDVKERLLTAGEEVVASSPEQSSAFIKSDIAKWAKVIKDAGIKVD